MPEKILSIKIDVDTDRGTRIGVPNLLRLFSELNISATFLFSLGPDNTGRAIKRVFRPGFLKKVSRSSVVSIYGLRTLMNGVLLPGPHIGKRNEKTMRTTFEAGHEVGIHCFDHIKWQDGLAKMTSDQVATEFNKARTEFQRIFGFNAKTAGAAGWQANAASLSVYDQSQLDYASDTRGSCPFFPRIDDVVYQTLQIPTNLPTLDELLGRPEYPTASLTDFYLNQLSAERINTFTIHAEIEGMKYLPWFRDFLTQAKARKISFIQVKDIAQQALENRETIPICDLIQGTVDGRSGDLAIQKR
jgi:undecaprenyl phosphate-alpha-L-ara4FN deformylase